MAIYLTGYHGTNKSSANNILKDRSFFISQGNEEWLGTGIYFYDNYSDALYWNKDGAKYSEKIIHAIIKIADDEFLDIDSINGHDLYYEVIKLIYNQCPEIVKGSVQENQCAVMNLIWDTNKNIKVIAASFAKEKTIIKTLIDARPKRREFCVKENCSIKDVCELPNIESGE